MTRSSPTRWSTSPPNCGCRPVRADPDDPRRASRQHRRPRQLVERAVLQDGTSAIRAVRGLRRAMGLRRRPFGWTWSSATPRSVAFFRLMIGRKRAGVDVVEVLFDDVDLDEPRRTSACPPRSPRRGCDRIAARAAARSARPPRRGRRRGASLEQGRTSNPRATIHCSGRRRVSQPYVLQLASQRTQWLSARESLIAGNVANANTPGYRATDLQPFAAVLDSTQVSMTTTNPAHITPTQDELTSARVVENDASDQTLSGNSVASRTRNDQAGRRQPRLLHEHEHQASHPSDDDVGVEVNDHA